MSDKKGMDTEHLVRRIRSGDRDAFEEVFSMYYAKLCVFSNSYVRSLDLSRDVVQEVFIKIWDNRNDFVITQSLKAYLYQAVRNQSLNQVNKIQSRKSAKERFKNQKKAGEEVHEQELNTEELTQKIWRLVDEMPERRRTVFILYRKHGLSYKEIAEVMGIKRKTVENHMGRSLQFLREHLDM